MRWLNLPTAAMAAAMTALLATCGAEQPSAPLAQTAQLAGAAAVGVSAAESEALRAGLEAAGAGSWDALRSARARSSDALVRKILLWRMTSDRGAATLFEEQQAALAQLQGWPGRGVIRQRAEQAIFDSGLPPAARLAFLREEGGPLTGDGKVAAAQALARLGERAEAIEVLRSAWRSNALTPRARDIALSEFGSALRESDHAARADLLLWRDEPSAAAQLLSRLSASNAAIVRARIALQRPPRRGLQAIVDNANRVNRTHPGLLYDRTRYIRRDGRPEDAIEVIARVDPADAPEAAREALQAERRLFIPRALRMRRETLAYTLATGHGLSRGEEFAESEWMAGWIALRFQDDPQKAAEHFQRLKEGVSTPVSLARANYWLGRAVEKRGDAALARTAFEEAAQYRFTYYGQLAAERIEDARIYFTASSTVTPEERAGFEALELVQALRLISQVGGRRDFEAMAFGLDDLLETPAQHELLSALAREQGFYKTAVRSAKAGLRRGVVAGDAAFPVLDLPPEVRSPGRPEPALTLAVARQESEFDPTARSGAGARGLMQVIPSTARAVARRIGLPYAPERLYEPEFNLTVGSAYLGDLVARYDGSYVLALAAYNAGPSRPSQWIDDWGDPRNGAIDPIDWVELIPFPETRNYVQRVLENLQVYRHRLSGEPTPVQLSQDLRRGGAYAAAAASSAR